LRRGGGGLDDDGSGLADNARGGGDTADRFERIGSV
jgi:hypothetical protein